MVEVPPPPKKKQKAGLEKRIAYKYPRARKFLVDLAVTCSAWKVEELLTVGIDFPELGMVKIES